MEQTPKRIAEQLDPLLKKALREKDTVTAAYVRNIKTKLTHYLVQNNKDRWLAPGQPLPVENDVVVKVLTAHASSLEASFVGFSKHPRGQTMIAEYQKEIDFCLQLAMTTLNIGGIYRNKRTKEEVVLSSFDSNTYSVMVTPHPIQGQTDDPQVTETPMTETPMTWAVMSGLRFLKEFEKVKG
jgi:uncharacterized protein YqeY